MPGDRLTAAANDGLSCSARTLTSGNANALCVGNAAILPTIAFALQFSKQDGRDQVGERVSAG